ncbi:hypothetical protein QZH41_005346 [Actinostola sp. cb2023]|nr:hypothetical protein QZH41_005346 [Actinostola sp. cb2023]
MNNTTSNTTTRSWQWDHDYENAKTWIRGITAFLVLFGNSVCLAAFLGSKSLRKRPHYLLIHLCLADFMVGISVLLRLVVDVYYWKYGSADFVFASFTFTLDYFSNIASIYVLTSISVERFLAIVFPIFHRMAGKGLYSMLMGIPWCLSCVTTVIYIFSNRMRYIDIDTFELTYLLVITTPVVLIFLAYSVILVKVRKNHVQQHNRTRDLRDRKLAVTLLMVTLASVFTWGPYNVYYVLAYYCNTCGIKFSKKVFFSLIVLQYWNSGVNLVVYFYRIPQFRRVVMGCCRKPKVTPQHSDSGSKQCATQPDTKKEHISTRL